MKLYLPAILAFSLPFQAGAALLKVGSGEAYASVQAAIDASSPGDTISVKPGTYNGTIVITKSPLTLLGSRSEVSARGRIPGMPDPDVESVLVTASGSTMTLANGAGAIVVRGFVITGAPGAGTGIVQAVAGAAAGFEFRNNHVEMSPSGIGSLVLLSGDFRDGSVAGNRFLTHGSAGDALRLTGGDWAGLSFVDNDVVRSGSGTADGLVLDGDRNVCRSVLRVPAVSNNLFSGHAVGFNSGSGALREAEIQGNLFSANGEGMAGGPSDSVISGNVFQSNARCGLRLTAFADGADASRGASGNVIETNECSGNGTVSNPDGAGDVILDDQEGTLQATNVIRRNRLRSTVGIHCNETVGRMQAARNYWNAADGPSGSGPGSGSRVEGAGTADVLPFYSDAALTLLSVGGGVFGGAITVGSGESLSGALIEIGAGGEIHIEAGGNLSADRVDLQPGGRLTIAGGTARIGRLQMAPGSTLDVVGGRLSLDPLGVGNFHTIDGSFTFFDSPGSMHINGNTTFSGSTLGLVSDIHVAAGVTVVVLGSLIFDGCTIDSPGTWNLLINSGAVFTMMRCRLSGAFISLVGNQVTLRDNTFVNTAITAFSTVSGASCYHNVLTFGSFLNVLPGAVIVTTADGWGNVSSASAVQNALTLHFRAPSDPTRTLDALGNLFVQPGDAFAGGIDISNLAVKAQAAETILGYNTGYIHSSGLAPSGAWNNGLYEEADESAIIGRFNSAVGLGFSFPDPDGSTVDAEVADLEFTAGGSEGTTGFFFLTKSGADHPLIDTRITASSGGNPYFVSSPYTANAGTLVIDGTPPVFGPDHSAVQVRDGFPFDVTLSGVKTRQGTVTVTFDARDDLAGIDDVDAAVALNGPGGTVAGTLAGTSSVVISGQSFTRYVFTIVITASAGNGAYDIDASVMDRSGNRSDLVIGTLEVSKNQIGVAVQPQALVAATLVRNVVFVATDSLGLPLAIWTVPVTFTGGVGTALLTEVPDGTLNLSAKMAWNLRVRLPANLDVNGQGTVAFTGSAQLRGGDFNGDNLVNLADYNILRAVFPGVASVPDITGDGQTTLIDYNVFRLNWLTVGAPL